MFRMSIKQAIILFETNRGTWALIGIIVHVQYHVIKKWQWRRVCDSMHNPPSTPSRLLIFSHYKHLQNVAISLMSHLLFMFCCSQACAANGS